MADETPDRPLGPFGRKQRAFGAALEKLLPAKAGRSRFRHWRRTRPFWAGLFAAVGGIMLIVGPLPLLPLAGVMVGAGLIGASVAVMVGVVLGIVLIFAALFFWFMPSQRWAMGVISILAGVVAFPLSNLGGFVVGTLGGILGGSMALAWKPHEQRPPPPRPTRHQDADPTRPQHDREQAPPPAKTYQPAAGSAWPTEEPSGPPPARFVRRVARRAVVLAPLAAASLVISSMTQIPLAAGAKVVPMPFQQGPQPPGCHDGVHGNFTALSMPETWDVHVLEATLSGAQICGIVDVPTATGTVPMVHAYIEDVQAVRYDLTYDADRQQGVPGTFRAVTDLDVQGIIVYATELCIGEISGAAGIDLPDIPLPICLQAANFDQLVDLLAPILSGIVIPELSVTNLRAKESITTATSIGISNVCAGFDAACGPPPTS